MIALDWGTTTLRAFLLGSRGELLAERAEPWGVMRLPEGGFAAAYAAIVDGWPTLPAIACGMVGSAQGWVAAPYVPCPATADALAAGLVAVPRYPVHVVPGVVRRGDRADDRADVMRGEETQIVGAMALRPGLAAGARLVLPGTHSKWVRVRDGAIVDLTTHLTGELYAVLRDHSILGRLAPGAPPVDEAGREAAFARGVRAAHRAAGGVGSLLFSARAGVLVGGLPAGASLEYLSGLLIGDELRSGLAADDPADRAPLALVGDPALCARYRAALAVLGADDASVVDGAAAAGLWAIAERAGLNARPV